MGKLTLKRTSESNPTKKLKLNRKEEIKEDDDPWTTKNAYSLEGRIVKSSKHGKSTGQQLWITFEDGYTLVTYYWKVFDDKKKEIERKYVTNTCQEDNTEGGSSEISECEVRQASNQSNRRPKKENKKKSKRKRVKHK